MTIGIVTVPAGKQCMPVLGHSVVYGYDYYCVLFSAFLWITTNYK